MDANLPNADDQEQNMTTIVFPMHQIRMCARHPNYARWPGHNVFQILASISGRFAPGWPMRARLVNMLPNN